jgi:hypothetical protein
MQVAVIGLCILICLSGGRALAADQAAMPEADPSKETLIRDIMGELAREYYVAGNTGLTYEVLLKDFDPTDEYTYALIEPLSTVWQILLPRTVRRNFGSDGIYLGRSISADRVRKDLVESITSGIRLQLVIPSPVPTRATE